MKKAQGMPLNTIIIAALVLLVLVILILIFTGRIDIFQKGLNKCAGSCSTTADCGEGKPGYFMGKCTDNTGTSETRQYCCPD